MIETRRNQEKKINDATVTLKASAEKILLFLRLLVTGNLSGNFFRLTMRLGNLAE